MVTQGGIGKRDFDYCLVGGGLQSALLATAIRHFQPAATIAILEQKDQLCGNHRWSFHLSDIHDGARDWFDRVPQTRWTGYRVAFPNYQRLVDSAYGSIRSQDFAEFLSHEAGERTAIHLGASISQVGHDYAMTADGRRWQADLVIDCRGIGSSIPMHCGYQKFFGFEFNLLDASWPVGEPTLMDSRIPQHDGYAFVYVLPFSATSVLIEITHFSDHARLEREVCWQHAVGYLHHHGIQNARLVGEESGCLPMPYRRSTSCQLDGPVIGGYRGGWFHPATGYSLPLAIQFAQTVATSVPEEAPARLRKLADSYRARDAFALLLNRMLFRLVSPMQRHQIFRRFYRSLPVDSIERFYAHQFTWIDAARILCGVPPLRLTPLRFIQSFEAKPCPVT
jgi:lycopene beta-cyclase